MQNQTNVDGASVQSIVRRPNCKFCGALPLRRSNDEWECGTKQTFFDDDDEPINEPMYETGIQCDLTVFRNGFIRCHDLLRMVHGYLVTRQPLPAELMELVEKEVSGEDTKEECEHCNGRGVKGGDRIYGDGTMALEGDCIFCYGTGVEQ